MNFLAPGPLTDSTGAKVLSLLQKYAAPDDVLEGNLEEVVDVPNIAVNFADSTRTYPVHNKTAAWVSAAAYHAGRSECKTTGDYIKKACEYHGIGGEWDRLSKARPAAETVAGVQHWGLPEAQKYPLDSEYQTKIAAEYFRKYASDFDPDERMTFADNLVKAAERHPGAVSPDALHRLEAEAGQAMLHPQWELEFDMRVKYAQERGLKEVEQILTGLKAEIKRAEDWVGLPKGLEFGAGADSVAPKEINVLDKLGPPGIHQEWVDANQPGVHKGVGGGYDGSGWLERMMAAMPRPKPINPAAASSVLPNPEPVPPPVPPPVPTATGPDWSQYAIPGAVGLGAFGLGAGAAHLYNQHQNQKKKEEEAQQAVKLASDSGHVETVGSFKSVAELADLLKQLDAKYGMKMYGDPADGIIGDTPSTARAKLAGVIQAESGNWYTRDSLDDLPDDLCSDLLDCGPIVSREKKAEMLQSEKYGATVERLLQSRGVVPAGYAPRPPVNWEEVANS